MGDGRTLSNAKVSMVVASQRLCLMVHHLDHGLMDIYFSSKIASAVSGYVHLYPLNLSGRGMIHE